MNIKNKYISTLVIFLVGLVCGLIINQTLIKKSVIQSQPTVSKQENSKSGVKADDQSYPWLNLPMEYFSNQDFRLQ